jgi:hypothetical protein
VDDADWPDGYKLQVTTMTVKFRSGVRKSVRLHWKVALVRPIAMPWQGFEQPSNGRASLLLYGVSFLYI